jgi:hypothetical protein
MRPPEDRVVLAVSSDTPAEAVEVAFGRAAADGVALLAVRFRHDPDLPVGGWLDAECMGRWEAGQRAARGELDRALDRACAAHPEVAVTTMVVDDDVVPFLTALSVGTRLLVLGRPHGGRSSPVDAVVRRAACPVLVVPPARRPEPAVASPSGRNAG